MKYLSLSTANKTPTKECENSSHKAVLCFSDIDMPNIHEDECLISVKAIGVNRADILQKQGKYPAPKGDSSILGIEVAGEISACGANVKDWQVGDRVFCIVGGGGYAQFVTVKAEHLIKTPDSYTDIEAAASAETFLTAYQSLFTIGKALKNVQRNTDLVENDVANSIEKGVKDKPSVLIHAGASGVGSAAIQLAKASGYNVVVTVSCVEKQQACLKLGADIALNYNECDFVTWSKKHIPHGYQIIVDVVAGDYVNKNVEVAALDSTVVVLSLLGGRFSERIDVAKLLLKRITLSASTLRNRSNTYKKRLISSFIDDFYTLLEQRNIMPLIDSVYQWEQVEQAHQRMENNLNIGKIVLVCES